MRKTLYVGFAVGFGLLGLAVSWLRAKVDVTQPDQGPSWWWGLGGGAVVGIVTLGSAEWCIRRRTRPELDWIKKGTEQGRKRKEEAKNMNMLLGRLFPS